MSANVTERIRALMQTRGWTEYRLVKETKLPASTIANIFHRGTTPSIVTLEIICDAFGISLCQFFADGPTYSLTHEQVELLNKWAALSKDQKEVVSDLMSKMN